MKATLVVDRLAVTRLIGFLLRPAGGRSVQQDRSLFNPARAPSTI